MDSFKKLLAVCLALDTLYRNEAEPGGYKLGSYSASNNRITLYGVVTTPRSLAQLGMELDTAGVGYRLLVLEPHRHRSNIHLLDIGI